MTTLGELQIGDRAKVVGFSQNSGYRRKLLALGLTPGSHIDIVRIAPMGDPVEIRIRGCYISLRKNEAAALDVEKL
ncbi:MAG: FeoA family protein [Tepidimonas sp.]|uniref:FeoA family protein n=1 Tax=Tepidimonas sp. TaxID=2002775 RepID=UPI00259E679E|nr:FeoA family protein [Tepidimonas sp.]MDM7456255.1 FeoA family protein [Tepidimonas sp.]